jgi:hypothetical protein
MMHEHDVMILTETKTKPPKITLLKCAWCLERYYLELQKVEDLLFCTSTCRKDWERNLDILTNEANKEN